MRSGERQLVALLPIKAHSSRVKRKNFRLLGEKPLFRWMLDELLSMEEITRVVINTDAPELLTEGALMRNSRVCMRERKSELRGDLVSMNRVLEDDMDNVPADTYLMTHATNPFLRAETIRRALAEYDRRRGSGVADSLFTVNRVQTRFYREDGCAVNHDPNELLRTQDLEPWFEENSCLYIFSAKSFRSTGARIGQKPVLFETPRLESLDIDTEEDWEHVEMLVRAGYRTGKGA